MADAYWRYAAADPRQQQQQPPPSAAAGAHPGMGAAPQMAPAGGQQPMKRPRPADFSGSPAPPRLAPRSDPRVVVRDSALAAARSARGGGAGSRLGALALPPLPCNAP